MDEFLAWLNGDRRNRDMQIQLDSILTKIRSKNNAHREQGIEELIGLFRGLKDVYMDAFIGLQDLEEYNVALAIMKAMSDKEASQPLRVDALVSALDVIQGVCLLHYPSKGLIGIDTRAIKMMLTRLETFTKMHGGKMEPKKSSTSLLAPRLPLNKRASSLVDTATMDPVVIMSCLDCLLAMLVDHDLCQVEFRQQLGIAFLVEVIQASSAPKEVRAKSAEFLLFLVRYFTESKDDHQQEVVQHLGEKLFASLMDSVTSTAKGPEKFDAFLKQADHPSK